jgi:hypothetical protein
LLSCGHAGSARDGDYSRDELVGLFGSLWQAQDLVIKIGKELGQRAMYFEVRDYDGVQILEVPAD